MDHPSKFPQELPPLFGKSFGVGTFVPEDIWSAQGPFLIKWPKGLFVIDKDTKLPTPSR